MAVNDGDILRVVLEITMPQTQIGANVFYWELSDPTPDNPSDAQILAAIDTRLDAMYSELQTITNNGYAYGDFEVEVISWDGTKWVTDANVGVGDINITGSSATSAVQHGVASVITCDTVVPKTRARKFFPGFARTEITDSILSGTALVALAAFATDWLTDQTVIGSAELIPIVISLGALTEGNAYPLLLAASNAIAGYQRRRKPGVGI